MWLPKGSILLVPHNHFGVDLSPGLSVKMNAAYVPDVVDIEGVAGAALRLVRQEFGGQVSAHVRCDVSSGAVINIRPGAFQPAGRRAGRGADFGNAGWGAERRGTALPGDGGGRDRRRGYHQAPDSGLDRPRHPGAGECGHRPGTGRCAGRRGELLEARGGRQVDGEIAAGGFVRPDRQAQGLPGMRHQRLVPAPGGASRAIPSSWPSTRTPRRPSFGWRMWGSSTTSWSSCRR